MASEVFHIPAGTGKSMSDMAERVGRLADAVGLGEIAAGDLFFMLKTHFGERGNNSYVKAAWITPLIEKMKAGGTKVFVSDTNTLYVGARSNAVDHLTVAREHGFTFDTLGAPVIIADGLVGENQSPVEVDLKHYRQVYIANDVRAADGIVVITNVTGHVLTGYAGAIKNVGMGLAGRGGKRSQHCDLSPEISPKKCVACGTCAQWCPTSAITVKKIAEIDKAKCIGCGECYAVCRYGAVNFSWSETSANMQEKLVEHCCGALKGKSNRCVFFNFITHVTKNCNCIGRGEQDEIPPLGIVAGTDMVAVDQACVDLCNKAAGEDLFARLYPSWDHSIQLSYAEEVGIGSRAYKLIGIS